MTISDLRLKIYEQIKVLEKDKLEEIYQLLLNFGQNEKELDHWTNLTNEQQQGILDAITELDEGKGIPHDKVMRDIRKQFPHA